MTEDIAAVDNLPTEQYPEIKPPAGWQDPPTVSKLDPKSCSHMGRSMAMLSIGRYDYGARWNCICGQPFVVAQTDGGKKTLRKVDDVVETPATPTL